MDALNALHTRVSQPRVCGPVPEEAALQNMFRAALRAPDHGQLRPWRFLRIEGEGLNRLAELFAQAAKADEPQISADKLDNIRGKALRSPLVIITISSAVQHPKIPVLEQDIAAGCATHAMLIAAHAQGIGAVWRTGPMSTHPIVTAGLGVQDHEKVLAMLYIGQIQGPDRPLRELAVEDFVTHWS